MGPDGWRFLLNFSIDDRLSIKKADYSSRPGDVIRFVAHKAMESGGTLTIELYLQMQKGQYDNAFGIGCVLIIIVLILNLLTKLAANKLRRE